MKKAAGYALLHAHRYKSESTLDFQSQSLPTPIVFLDFLFRPAPIFRSVLCFAQHLPRMPPRTSASKHTPPRLLARRVKPGPRVKSGRSDKNSTAPCCLKKQLRKSIDLDKKKGSREGTESLPHRRGGLGAGSTHVLSLLSLVGVVIALTRARDSPARLG